MNFEKDHIYHIYNQGNNRQKIFFERENYLHFLWKINKYILPYSDILAWCLMPNHFHLMVLVKKVELLPATLGMSQKHTEPEFARSFNSSIGLLLMSYAKAVNKQQKRTGKLFREATKAECITCTNGITPSFYTVNGIAQINIIEPAEEQYPQVCFNYIHQNPVSTGLVDVDTDWEFSSAKDYAGVRNGKLINRKVTEQYVNF